MIVKCIENEGCSTLTKNKDYLVIDEATEYFVIIDDSAEERTCRKNRFSIVEDGGLRKKAKATITELEYQLNNDCKDIKKYSIRKNSKNEIKEIVIKFKYDL